MSAEVIAASELIKRFNGFTAVDGIDITVNAGEVLGLLGANGAGKTTAIRMLCGTLPPSAGAITVDGIDMIKHPRRARSRLGYVSQRFALYGELSVAENLKLQAGLYGVGGSQKRERIDWALDHLELRDHRDTIAAALPLGFKRRLALGAALLHSPKILFLDEPTSGVDPLARQRFWELIYDIAESGVGILVTTHYMDEAMFCDNLALMDAGRIIERGTPQQLLATPIATPLLALWSPDRSALAGILAQVPEVIEVIPRGEQLRVRLSRSSNVEATAKSICQTAAEHSVVVERFNLETPELEDVFVAALEKSREGNEP